MRNLHAWFVKYEPEIVFGIFVAMAIEVIEVIIQVFH